MIARFYFIEESFLEIPSYDIETIESKIKALALDYNLICKYKDSNKILVNDAIYSVPFINSLTLCEFLYNDTSANNILDRDVRLSLKNIIIESESISLSSDEIKEITKSYSSEACSAIIGFNVVQNVANFSQITYNENNWYDFRRYFLSKYPIDDAFFIDECQKYFPNLYFHENNKITISPLFRGCIKGIVFHLSALNDKFRQCQIPGLNRTEVLRRFTIEAHLPVLASLEGNASKKRVFTFPFTNSHTGREEQICCEPHLKLCYTDNYPGDQSYSNNRRIYFHEGKSEIHDGKILIGYIGVHL